jgi:hypothetical protein
MKTIEIPWFSPRHQLVFHPLRQAMHLRKLQELRAAGALLRHLEDFSGTAGGKITKIPKVNGC